MRHFQNGLNGRCPLIPVGEMHAVDIIHETFRRHAFGQQQLVAGQFHMAVAEALGHVLFTSIVSLPVKPWRVTPFRL